jgi:hypothetical protein
MVDAQRDVQGQVIVWRRSNNMQEMSSWPCLSQINISELYDDRDTITAWVGRLT